MIVAQPPDIEFKLIGKPHLLEAQVTRQEFNFFAHMDPFPGGVFHGGPYHLREVGQVAQHFVGLVVEDIILDSVDAVKNEMGVHLCLQRLDLQFSHGFFHFVLLFPAFAYVVDVKVNTHNDQYQEGKPEIP